MPTFDGVPIFICPHIPSNVVLFGRQEYMRCTLCEEDLVKEAEGIIRAEEAE